MKDKVRGLAFQHVALWVLRSQFWFLDRMVCCVFVRNIFHFMLLGFIQLETCHPSTDWRLLHMECFDLGRLYALECGLSTPMLKSQMFKISKIIKRLKGKVDAGRIWNAGWRVVTTPRAMHYGGCYSILCLWVKVQLRSKLSFKTCPMLELYLPSRYPSLLSSPPLSCCSAGGNVARGFPSSCTYTSTRVHQRVFLECKCWLTFIPCMAYMQWQQQRQWYQQYQRQQQQYQQKLTVVLTLSKWVAK